MEDDLEAGVNAAKDAMKSAWKGLRSFSMSTASGSTSEAPSEGAASSSAGGNKTAKKEDSWVAWADKARKMVADKAREVAYDVVPTQEGSGSRSSSPDLENGGQESQPRWAGWAKAAVGRVRTQMSEAANTVSEKAKSVEVDGLKSEVSRGLSGVAKGATAAGAALADKGKAAAAKANDIKGKGAEKLKEAKNKGVENAKKAKEKAAQAAGAAKGLAAKAGSNLQGLGALAMSPAKLAQFGGLFFVGMFLISTSFSMLIMPTKFGLMFAFGSLTLLSSFAVLKGPKNFAKSLIQWKKLPFSGAYFVGLIGTLASTIVMKNFLLAAFFGVMQAVGLVYFLASYVPGGKALLNFCGKCCKKGARAVGGRLMRSG